MRCSKVYKNRGSRRRKKHGTGQGSKAAVQKPERRLPDRLGQAGTDRDKAHKAACLSGWSMGLDCSKQQNLKQCGGSQSRLVRNVLQYIRSHMAEPIRTADIAAYCGKSRGGLTTEFKKQTGRTLSDFIQQQKMQEAETLLLKTEQNLSQISSLLGFSSQSHFTRVFKEVHGMTPTEFRKSQG